MSTILFLCWSYGSINHKNAHRPSWSVVLPQPTMLACQTSTVDRLFSRYRLSLWLKAFFDVFFIHRSLFFSVFNILSLISHVISPIRTNEAQGIQESYSVYSDEPTYQRWNVHHPRLIDDVGQSLHLDQRSAWRSIKHSLDILSLYYLLIYLGWESFPVHFRKCL